VSAQIIQESSGVMVIHGQLGARSAHVLMLIKSVVFKRIVL